MIVRIIFVSSDFDVCEAINLHKERLIPRSLRAMEFGVAPSIIALHVQPNISEANLLTLIENNGDKCAGLLVFAPRHLSHLLLDHRKSLYVFDHDPFKPRLNLQNQIAGTVNKGLRNFLHLATKFNDRKYQRSLLLPLRSFDAPAIGRMINLLSNVSQNPTFIRLIDEILRDLRDLQHPKRAGKEIHILYSDCSNKVFELTRADHARAETAMPPHNSECGIGGARRFGLSYEDWLHFDCRYSDGSNMNVHTFPGCHDQGQKARRKSHANIFPNDYIT